MSAASHPSPPNAETAASASADPREHDAVAILEARQAARARVQASIPKRYNPWLHLAGTVSVGVATLVVGAFMVHRPTIWEWLTVPITFLVANAFEWRAHKYTLHRRHWPLQELYDRHTPQHHVVFGYDDMAVRRFEELRLVLIPAVGVASVVVVSAIPALLLGWLWSPNRGWLMLMTSAFYVVGYELSHMSYHLPPDSFIGRLWLVRVLREHHRRHHHVRLMQKWNFNVTIPIWDFVRGTVVPKSLLRETLEEDRRALEAAAPNDVDARSPH